ncbi:C-C motif chemokine 27a [Synchiropus splendidus]|uniref:C-C motif chemokine 27a n=1 Tax=Synchiropus splendidus TaxID=270530 RepID=UPI00237E3AEB|nr:C-C motif chemokine 27a [Synchiropus splendidus]
MDLKVVIVVVCLCALAVTSTEGGIPKCCMTTQTNIPKRILIKVYKWEIQRSNGACNIQAVIFYVKGMSKPLCAHPQEKLALSQLKMRMNQLQQKRAEKRI